MPLFGAGTGVARVAVAASRWKRTQGISAAQVLSLSQASSVGGGGWWNQRTQQDGSCGVHYQVALPAALLQFPSRRYYMDDGTGRTNEDYRDVLLCYVRLLAPLSLPFSFFIFKYHVYYIYTFFNFFLFFIPSVLTQSITFLLDLRQTWAQSCCLPWPEVHKGGCPCTAL